MSTTTRTARTTRRTRPAVVTDVPTPEVEVPVTAVEEAPPVVVAKKPKAAPLTLSQRRALLRLQQNDAWSPLTAFAELPYLHLVEHGLATAHPATDAPTAYQVTASGSARTINPGYATWSAGETVAADPSRPVAGTHRTTRCFAPDGPAVIDPNELISANIDD